MKKLFLDDIRYPKSEEWIIVRSYSDFVKWIEDNGVMDLYISFDHDLDDVKDNREYTGYDCAKWLCEYCWENGLPIPKWNIHSANPVGKSNIDFIMKGFEKRLNH